MGQPAVGRVTGGDVDNVSAKLTGGVERTGQVDRIDKAVVVVGDRDVDAGAVRGDTRDRRVRLTEQRAADMGGVERYLREACEPGTVLWAGNGPRLPGWIRMCMSRAADVGAMRLVLCLEENE